MERVAEFAKRRLREAIEEGLIAGRIEEDGEVILDDTAAPPPPRRRPT
jgi:hypothetical protein